MKKERAKITLFNSIIPIAILILMLILRNLVTNPDFTFIISCAYYTAIVVVIIHVIALLLFFIMAEDYTIKVTNDQTGEIETHEILALSPDHAVERLVKKMKFTEVGKYTFEVKQK